MSRAWAGAIATVALLAGCATDSTTVTEYLDPQTAVTIRAVAMPSVYSHDMPELAANVRDYLSVGAVEVNNMGKRRHYLVLVSWSTIDWRRTRVSPVPAVEHLGYSVAGTRRDLTLASHDARTLGIGTPLFRPDSGYLSESWFAVSAADLRAYAAAPPETLEIEEPSGTLTYVSWRRADAALQEFVRDIPDAPAAAAPRR